MKMLLFVCSGNCGRSPAAQYLAQQYVESRNLAIEVQSRGTNVRANATPDFQLVTALPAAKSHIPTALDTQAVERADLILTMNRQHQRIVTDMAPGAAAKTHCLYEYADGTAKAVPDPVDYGREDYEDFLEEMRRLVRGAIDKFATP